jgi:hypothetical protein
MKIIEINNKHYQECDIVMLKSGKNNSKIGLNLNAVTGKLLYYFEQGARHDETQHLYILSNEEIKEDDYVYHKTFGLGKIIIENNEECFQSIPKHSNDGSIITPWKRNIPDIKKVIAITDKSLIDESKLMRECYPYSIHQIHQQFIEYFINEYNKGNMITKVLVEVGELWVGGSDYRRGGYPEWQIKLNQNNEISILTEQKTLEEAALQYLTNKYGKMTPDEIIKFLEGAKWQAEQSYNREEVIELIKDAVASSHDWSNDNNDIHSITVIEKRFLNNWIEENLK